MSFFKVGDKFGVNQANLLKKMGLDDITGPGVGEIRLIKEGDKYILKVWEGGGWKAINEVDENRLYKGNDISWNIITHNNYIETGHAQCDAGAAAWITRNYVFSEPFLRAPRVFLQFNLFNKAHPTVKSISTTGFVMDLYRHSDVTSYIDWLAVGEK